MNLLTGLSIYNKQWLIEPNAAVQLADLWEQVKDGKTSWNYDSAMGKDRPETAYKLYQRLFEKEQVIMSPASAWDMEDFAGFDGAAVAVIPVSGPLMKADYCGAMGTNTLKMLTDMASNTASVRMILFVVDSPGGTVDGTQTLADAIQASTKRTVALADELMCSAAYWIGSSCDEVYASSSTSIIGSIGTMCSFWDNTKALEKSGYVRRTYYATASKDKNKMFDDAQNGDGQALVQELLNPTNDVFMAAVRQNRAGKIDEEKENVLTGKTYTSAAAKAGGLIDDIRSFDQIVKSALQQGPYISQGTKKTNTMSELKTLAELKATYPKIHEEAVAEGVAQERGRVAAWMAFKDIDATATLDGIGCETAPTAATISEMAVANFKKTAITLAAADNAQPVATEDTKVVKTKEELELEGNMKELKTALGLK